MKPEVIKEGRELGEKATPRPWESYNSKNYPYELGVHVPSAFENIVPGKTICRGMRGVNRQNNSAFIAHACNNYIPALDHIERLTKALEYYAGGNYWTDFECQCGDTKSVSNYANGQVAREALK